MVTSKCLLASLAISFESVLTFVPSPPGVEKVISRISSPIIGISSAMPWLSRNSNVHKY